MGKGKDRHTELGLKEEDLLEMYRLVALARAVDERMWILNRAGKIDRRALAKMLDPALPHPDATGNPHVVPCTCGGGTATGSCPDAC